MSFKRSRVQLICESLINCPDIQSWYQNRENFENYILTKNDKDRLLNDLNEDAKDFYFKGLLSLCESINSVYRNLYSWATVKIYYSVYYFLRSSLALKGYAVVRNKSLYLLKAEIGERPLKKRGKSYNSTHYGTIQYFKDLFEASDKLQSNLINGQNAYIWLMDRREQINYHEISFHDPSCSDFWEEISEYVNNGTIQNLLIKYFNDVNYIYCFQEDHACLALPIKRAIMTKEDFDDNKININLSIEKIELIKELLKIDANHLKEFEYLIG